MLKKQLFIDSKYSKAIESLHGDEQGAALVVTVLLTLVLTAVGVVALQTTMRSMQESGSYRMRTQAQISSDAALVFTSRRVGDKANVYWKAIYNAGRADEAVERGGLMMIEPETFVESGAFSVPANSAETGLFTEGTVQSVDTILSNHNAVLNNGQPPSGAPQGADFRVIIRDPLEGPLQPGYSADDENRMCYKKVFFASEVNYGLNDTEWSKPVNAASARNGLGAYIGPVECGN